MINIIGITGKKRSGKDTVAEYLLEKYNSRYLSFATPIKLMINSLLEYLELDSEYYESNKEEIIPILNVTYRFLCKFIGTDSFRDRVSKEFWINIANHVRRKDCTYVISDIRMNNEAEWVISQAGIIFKIERDTPGIIDTHESEAGIDPKYYGSNILDNNGTLNDLYQQIEKLLWTIHKN